MEIVFIWIVCAVIGALIGRSKGRTGAGLALGLLLGPLGLIIALLLKKDQARVDSASVASGDSKKCPHCAELIRTDAQVCRFCGNSVV